MSNPKGPRWFSRIISSGCLPIVLLPPSLPPSKIIDFISGPHGDDDERIYHAYYQWVPLMLFFQAICFYAPHWIWKQCDNGKIKVRLHFG